MLNQEKIKSDLRMRSQIGFWRELAIRQDNRMKQLKAEASYDRVHLNPTLPSEGSGAYRVARRLNR